MILSLNVEIVPVTKIKFKFSFIFKMTGKHTYSPFPLLEDYCDAGTPWNTWENLIIIPWNESPYP
jgi:hypothetical protein